MTTHKKLSPDALRILQSKSAIAFNKQILDDLFAFVFNKVSDIDFLIDFNDKLESYLETLDVTTISKPLSNHESNSKENSN